MAFSLSFAFLLAAKVIGAAKEMVIAHAFGAGPVIDAYALAFALSQMPVTFTAMVANMVLIPLCVAARQGDGDAAAQGRRIMRSAMGLSVPLALLVYVGLAHLMPAMSAAPPELLAELRRQALPVALAIPPGCLAAVLAARLMAGGNHMNSLLESLPSVALVLGIWVFEGRIASSTLLGWSLCAGCCAYALVLAVIDRPSLPPEGTARQSRRAPVIAILFGQAVFLFGGDVFDQAAAFHMGEGMAHLAYANRLVLLLCALVGTAVSRAFLPVLAEVALRGGAGAMRLVYRWAAAFALCGLLAALVGSAHAEGIVRFIYERGAFLPADTIRVASLLSAGFLILPVYFPALFFAQALVLQGRAGAFLAANVGATLVKIAFVMLFLPAYGMFAIIWGGILRQLLVSSFMLAALVVTRRRITS